MMLLGFAGVVMGENHVVIVDVLCELCSLAILMLDCMRLNRMDSQFCSLEMEVSARSVDNGGQKRVWSL